MQITGKFILKGSAPQIWDFILDPGVLLSCLPGAETIKKIDDKTYEAVVKQKVGPISAKFKFSTTLVETRPPTYIKAAGKGADVTKLGNFTQETVITLKELGNGEVEVAYDTNAVIVGKLATFGERIMRAKAAELGAQFTKNLEQTLKARMGGGEEGKPVGLTLS